MTITVDHQAPFAAPLAPVSATLRAMFGTDDLPGVIPGLLVVDETDWWPATELVTGARIPDLLAAAARMWRGTSHACAALTWKSYSYYAALPAILGWASARRVPLLYPTDVLHHSGDNTDLPTLGLRRCTTIAVLPGDPLALAGRPEVRVVTDEAELLGLLRASLLDEHLTPVLSAIQREVRIGTRTMLGSVASGIAHGILRAADVLPGSATEQIDTLLDALDLTGLVDLVPGPTGKLTVQRRTCCLAFTLPSPRYCPGCCVKT